MSRAYFSLSLRNVLFEICLTFLHSKTFKFACCLGRFHLRIAAKLCPFFIHTARKSCFSRICPNEEGRLVPDLLLFFKKALYEVKASSLQFGFTYLDSPQLDIQQKEIV